MNDIKDRPGIETGIKIDVEIELDRQFVYDALTTSIECGYNAVHYWGVVHKVERDSDLNVLRYGLSLIEPIGDHNDEKIGSGVVVDSNTVQLGIQRLLDGSVPIDSIIRGYVFSAVIERDAGHIDADAADCIIQAGVFGELIFG